MAQSWADRHEPPRGAAYMDHNQPPEPRASSLRRVFWLALLPMSLLLLASFALIILMVSRVHHNVQRMLVETGEIAQARALADELHGIESWVQAAPTLAPVAREAVDADARQHLDAATDLLRRFGPPTPDPSDPEHQSEEDNLVGTIRTELALLRRLLVDERSGLENADPHVRAATRTAESLATKCEAEGRELGERLVQSSQDFVQFVVVSAAIAALTLVAAMWLFQRRIMRPLAELREAARRIGEGEQELRLVVRHEDELGLLARTLQAMTGRLRAQQEDLEERVAQRTNELLRTARLADLGTLAAGVAHEINNPLAAIATCAEGLLRDEQRALAVNGAPGHAHDGADGRERIREYLGIIAKEALRVRDTTARLLAFARPESGRREPVWLQREVREVATMLDHSATRAGVTLDLDLAQNTPPVLGDPADLRQVAFNLLKNALDASSHGGAVAIRLSQRDDNVVLEVEDHGHGVAAEVRDRIFEPFVTTKAPGDGTGLGLAISHRIVTDHGGSVRLHTPSRGGACFTVTLPRLR